MSDLRSKSVDAIIWNLIEKYGVQLFSLIIGVILARLLTPADYGLIGMISVFFALAMVFVNSGFGTAYIQKKDVDETDASTIFYFNIVVSLIVYLVLWISAPIIAKFYNQPILLNLTRVSAIVLITNSLGMMQNTILIKKVDFKKKTIISLISNLISGIIGIVAALSGYEVWSLVFQQLSRSIINNTGLWLFYSWRPKLVFRWHSLKSLFSFSSWVLLSSLIITFFDNIYLIVIGKLFPISELGFYSKARGYQKMASQQPSSAIAIVSFPVFSKLQNNKLALKNSMKKFMTYTLFFLAPIVVILIIIADPLIFVVLTEKWMPMVPYFQLLLIAGYLYPIHRFNANVLTAQGKTKLNFKLNIFKNVLRLLNIIIMYRFGVLHIIYGEVIFSLLALVVNGYYTKIFINYGMLEQLKDLSKTILISLIIVFLGFLLLDEFSNNFIKLGLGIIFAISGYIFLQYIFNKQLLLNSRNLIKDKLSNK